MLYLLNFLYSVGLNAISKVLPAYLASKGASASAISAINSSYGITRGLGPPSLGRTLDRLPRLGLLFGSLLTTAVLAVLASRSTSTVYLVALFGLYGLVSSVFYMTINAVATIQNADRKAHALSNMEFVYQAGFVIGTLGAAIASLHFGMSAVFVIWCVTALVGAAALAIVMRSRTASPPRSRPSSLGELFDQLRHGVGTFLTGSSAVGIVEGARDVYVPIALIRAGHEYQSAGYVFAIAAAVTGLGLLVVGSRLDRFGWRRSLDASFAAMTIGILLLPVSHSLVVFGVVVGVISLGRSVGLTITRAHASDVTTDANRATGLGVYELFFSAGKIIGAIVTGVLMDTVGTSSVWMISIIVVVGWILVSRRD